MFLNLLHDVSRHRVSLLMSNDRSKDEFRWAFESFKFMFAGGPSRWRLDVEFGWLCWCLVYRFGFVLASMIMLWPSFALRIMFHRRARVQIISGLFQFPNSCMYEIK